MLEAIKINRRVGELTLLKDVSLSVSTGQRLAVIGPSGSGKTLLLRSLARLDPIDSGEIRWRGELIRGHKTPKFRSRVVYLHQRPALIEGTVEDNLRLPFSLQIHRGKSFERKVVLSLLKTLGRDETFLSKPQRVLSGGESQITALLRALILDPDVLLLDEPTAAIDKDATDSVEKLVAEWLAQRKNQQAIILATHDLEQARRVSDQILQMTEGSLVSEHD